MKRALPTSVLVLFGIALAVPASCQSLGDIAKKQKSSSSQKAKIVVTEDDIPASPNAADTSNSVGADKSAESSTANPGEGNTPNISKEPKPENAAALKARLNELTSKQQEYEISIAQLEQKLQNAPTDFRAETYKNALENDRRSLKTIKQQRDNAEKQLAEMQDKLKSSSSDKAGN